MLRFILYLRTLSECFFPAWMWPCLHSLLLVLPFLSPQQITRHWFRHPSPRTHLCPHLSPQRGIDSHWYMETALEALVLEGNTQTLHFGAWGLWHLHCCLSSLAPNSLLPFTWSPSHREVCVGSRGSLFLPITMWLGTFASFTSNTLQ
jgi:hypothetical protein